MTDDCPNTAAISPCPIYYQAQQCICPLSLFHAPPLSIHLPQQPAPPQLLLFTEMPGLLRTPPSPLSVPLVSSSLACNAFHEPAHNLGPPAVPALHCTLPCPPCTLPESSRCVTGYFAGRRAALPLPLCASFHSSLLLYLCLDLSYFAYHPPSSTPSVQ